MFAEVLSMIYHDAKYSGFLNGVERLLKCVKQLNIPNATRHTVQEYVNSEQVYKLH